MTSDDPAGQAPDGPVAGTPDDEDPLGAGLDAGGPADAAHGGSAAEGSDPDSGRAGDLRRPGANWLARAGHLEFDRVLFFSDAIFAIAITLLALDLRVPVGRSFQAGHELRTAVPGIVSFAISFVVIGLFWLGHHSLFRHIIAFDRPLMLLNLLFLGTIAFLPFPTEVLGLTSTRQAAAVIFYAACCAAAGLMEAAVWLYATRPGGGLAAPSAARMRIPFLLQTARAPVIFLLSIPVALYSATLATYMWILIFVTGVVMDRWPHRVSKQGTVS
jgi:uncharacterized membrane protein